jgi:hypothetical protein
MAYGTATIHNDEANGIYIVRFRASPGSDLIGQQLFGNSNAGFRAALRFLTERGITTVTECKI